MTKGSRYPIPADLHRTEEIILRSRFITLLAPAASITAAQAMIQRQRLHFPDATHHCWAYLVGPPGSAGSVGMSDDGEPHGTAGRPMLTVLQHSGVGDIVAVVVRYYGGTNLGTGGLVRAYSGGVKQALASLPLAEHVARTSLTVTLDYGNVNAMQQLLPQYEAEIVAQNYREQVCYQLRMPEERVRALQDRVHEITRGQARIEIMAGE